MKINTIKIPIFFGRLKIIKTKHNRRERKKIEKKYGLRKIESNPPAYCWNSKDVYYLVLTDKADKSIIVHECVHLVNFIFKDCGIDPDTENDETQAYLTGWLFKKINKN